MHVLFFFFVQRVRVAALQSKLSWSLLSCYCGHYCCYSFGCSSWLLLRRLLCCSSGLGCSTGCSFWLLLRALLLAASAVLFSATPLGALVGCVNWGTFLPASEDAPTMAASWAAAFTFHVTAFVVTDIFYSADVVLEEGEAPRWPPKLSSSWNLRPCFSLCHSACRCPRLYLPLRPYIFFLRHVRDFLG